MKTHYNVKKIDQGFRKWLEEFSGCELTGITLLLSPTMNPQVNFWRFELEGIKDTETKIHLRKNPFTKFIPPLRYAWQDKIIRVCQSVNSPFLIIDLISEDALYSPLKDLSDFPPVDARSVKETPLFIL